MSSIREIPNRQWEFLIIDEDGSVYGTDDIRVAKEQERDARVINAKTGQIVEWYGGKEPVGRNIPEQTLYHF